MVTRNFPPLHGGMERLNWHLADELAKVYDVRVIAPIGVAEHAPCGIKALEVPLKPLVCFLLSACLAAWREAHIWRPDIILAGSGLTTPIAWIAALFCKARTVAYVHGLDVVVPHPVYRTFWLPVLRRVDCVIANSFATAKLAELIGVMPARIGVVHPGVDLPKLDQLARGRFREAHGLGDAPVLLSVGRLTERKGLLEFVREVLPLVIARLPDTQLVIVGDVPENALYAKAQTHATIKKAAIASGVQQNVLFLGLCTDEVLSDAYAAADVHVFPIRAVRNDPEGFGMVAVEAAAHGLPTVAYATGGVMDAVNDGVSGRLVAAGDSRGFAEAIFSLLESPIPVETVSEFAAQFQWERFGIAVQQELEARL